MSKRIITTPNLPIGTIIVPNEYNGLMTMKQFSLPIIFESGAKTRKKSEKVPEKELKVTGHYEHGFIILDEKYLMCNSLASSRVKS